MQKNMTWRRTSFSGEYSSQGSSLYHWTSKERPSGFWGKFTIGWQGPTELENVMKVWSYFRLLLCTWAGSVGLANLSKKSKSVDSAPFSSQYPPLLMFSSPSAHPLAHLSFPSLSWSHLGLALALALWTQLMHWAHHLSNDILLLLPLPLLLLLPLLFNCPLEAVVFMFCSGKIFERISKIAYVFFFCSSLTLYLLAWSSPLIFCDQYLGQPALYAS